MTGAIGLPDPDDPQEPPLETEGVGEDPGSMPDPEPKHDGATAAFNDDQDDSDAMPRGQVGPSLDLGEG